MHFFDTFLTSLSFVLDPLELFCVFLLKILKILSSHTDDLKYRCVENIEGKIERTFVVISNWI